MTDEKFVIGSLLFEYFSSATVTDLEPLLWDDGSWQEYWSLADWFNTEEVIYVKFVVVFV